MSNLVHVKGRVYANMSKTTEGNFCAIVAPYVIKASEIVFKEWREQGIEVPSNLVIHVKKIREANTRGLCQYNNADKSIVITIDPHTLNGHQLVATVAHELRHAWQYMTGKLSLKLHRKTATRAVYDRVWEGRQFAKHKNFTQYQNAPWEKDANSYAERFIKLYKDSFPEVIL